MSINKVGSNIRRTALPCLIPSDIKALVRGYSWASDTIGKGGGTVYRLQRRGKPGLYLKRGCGAVACDITREMERLRWLAGRIPVPDVRHFVVKGDEAWLLSTALPGRSAHQLMRQEGVDHIAIVDVISRFLRRIHSLPAEECPFNSGYRNRLIDAQERLAAGLVDTGSFEPQHHAWTAEKVWHQMMSHLPMTCDSVVTHGDFSLDNILIDDGEVSGVIDVARAGAADRYQDLAILWRDLGDFDPLLQKRLFVDYSIANPDERKLSFYVTLDEFF